MKCPKCSYIGFEATDRCRNCGCEFALAAEAPADPDLPIASGDDGGPLVDLAIRPDAPVAAPPAAPARPAVDLDRLVGVPETPAPAATRTPDLPLFMARPQRSATPPRPSAGARQPTPASHTPRVTTPRSPVGVRPSTGEPVRPRPRPREDMRVKTATLDLPLPPLGSEPPAHDGEVDDPVYARADTDPNPPMSARVTAAAIDAMLVGGVDLATVYLTLRMVGLGFSDWHLLPVPPLVAFFLILNGGYLALFTAASGQTIGKMAAGLKVVGTDAGPVSLGAASVRALGAMASTMLLGVGLWPALVDADRRALYDRLADTRVVRVDS
jgi:resuscitation-promoting factor RpfA